MQKRVLVTGASRGIGKATAIELASKGYDLYLICSSSMDELESVRNYVVDKYGIDCRIAQTDVSNKEEVTTLIKDVLGTNDLYAIINNAAMSYVGLLTQMSFEDWTRVMDTNLNSVFWICHEAVPYFINQKCGKIINISSMWGQVGASMEVAYSTAKGGVDSFTKALAKELAPSNVQVNAVSFGVIDTAMNSCFSAEEMQELVDEIPACRLGYPKECAEMIVSILESPDYLTGQIIRMDGGLI